MIKVVAKMNISTEAIGSAMPLIEELIAATVQEEGCIAYNFCKELGSADAYAILESWETQEALDAHSSSEHFIRILPQLGAFVTGDVAITAYEVLV